MSHIYHGKILSFTLCDFSYYFTIIWIEFNFPARVLFNLLYLLLKISFPKLGKKFNNKHSCNKFLYLAVPFIGPIFVHTFGHLSSGPDCVQRDKVSIDSLMNLNHI